jgi:hypothetical protein
MKIPKILTIIFFSVAIFHSCNKLKFKKVDTSRLYPSFSDWTESSYAGYEWFALLPRSEPRPPCITSGVKLAYATCASSEIIPQNGCVSGSLQSGSIKYYRYYASGDENLSMLVDASVPNIYKNCVATYKENVQVDTNSPVSELEINQSLTSCQPNTGVTIKSGTYRCVSVHSFCDSSYYLKLGNTSAWAEVTGAGNANLTLPTWSKSETTYIPIEGTGTPIVGDNTYWSIPIGFSFTFFGQTFTSLYASTNGFISFSTLNPENTESNNLFVYKSGIPAAVIAPWWANMIVDCSSSVQYQATGTTGNRILTVEWKNILLNTYDSRGSGNINRRLNFQVKLYETTNIIDLIYGPASGNTNSNEFASLGIKSTVGDKFIFINAKSDLTTDTTRYKNISFPASGTVYRFTP